MNPFFGLFDLARAPALLAQQGPVARFIFGRDPQEGTYSAGVESLFMFIFWISTFVFIGLMAISFYWAVKYRRRPGVAPQRSPSHNTALEITWTIIPSIVFISLFFVGFRVYAKQVIAPSDAVRLDLIGYRWGWNLYYPGGVTSTETLPPGTISASSVPVFMFPEDTPILLEMSSQDVIHSFWVPDFRSKMDLFPNRSTSFWFRTSRLEPGDMDNPDLGYPNKEHILYCAEYCGDQHSQMLGLIRVVPRDVYENFLRNPWPEGISLVEKGKLLHSLRGCNACHSLDGSSGTGPTWLNWYGYEHRYTDGSTQLADADFTRESIYHPGRYIRSGYQNVMNSYLGQINEEEMRALIAFMRSISDQGGDPTAGFPEEEQEETGGN